MSFRYPRHRIQEIVNAPKALSDGGQLRVKPRGTAGASFDVLIELKDGPFCDLRYLGRAGRKDEPETYESSLLLEQQRIRGVGYCAIGKQNFRAKLRVPAGWHQNICDPNAATDDPEWNRHEPLPDFAPSDFKDFIRRSAWLWSIDPGWEKELL